MTQILFQICGVQGVGCTVEGKSLVFGQHDVILGKINLDKLIYACLVFGQFVLCGVDLDIILSLSLFLQTCNRVIKHVNRENEIAVGIYRAGSMYGNGDGLQLTIADIIYIVDSVGCATVGIHSKGCLFAFKQSLNLFGNGFRQISIDYGYGSVIHRRLGLCGSGLCGSGLGRGSLCGSSVCRSSVSAVGRVVRTYTACKQHQCRKQQCDH